MKEKKQNPIITGILIAVIALLGIIIGIQIGELKNLRNEPVEPDPVVLPSEGSYNPEQDGK